MAFGSSIKKSSISENWLFDFYNQDSYLSFDGTNDYIDLGATTASSTLSLTSTEDLSVAMWVNFPVEDASEWIFLNNTVDSGYSGIAIYKDSGNKFSIIMGDGSGVLAGDYKRFRTSTTYSANTWYHVVITTGFANDGSDTVFYVNGSTSGISLESAGSESSISTPSYASGNAYFGRQAAPSPDSYGQFKIRSLGIWSGILNANDVTAIYNSGKYHNLAKASGHYASADVNKLKAYWKFNNGVTATDFINDVSGKINGATYTGSGLHLAFKDTSYNNNFYHGVIKNKPSIRESIDLFTSKAKRSNLSVDIPDFKYKGSPISEELFGSNVYLNQDVKVYSQIDADTPELIGCYRLSDISSNGDSLTLSLKSFHPWDNVSFPQDKTPLSKIYIPAVYGDFTPNLSYASSLTLCGQALYPTPVLAINDDEIMTLMPRSYSSGSNCHINMYHGNNGFLPFQDNSDGSRTDETTTIDNYNALRTSTGLYQNGYLRPKESTDQGASGTNFSNMHYAFDGDATTFSTVSVVDANNYLMGFTSGFEEFFYTDYYYTVKVTHKYSEDASIKVYIGFSPYTATPGETTISFDAGDLETTTFVVYSAERQVSIPWKLLYVKSSGDNGTLSINDIQVQIVARIFASSDDQDDDRDRKSLQKTQYFYSGGDGLTHGITGLSSAITEIHEAHLDLMHRFAGLDVATNPATNIEGWGTGSDHLLDYAKDWKIRYWELEPTSLTKALEKLQYEGGFIFTLRRGDLTQPEYIFIRDTYDPIHYSGVSQINFPDINKYDLSDVQIKPDSFSSVVTKMDINYFKHPAENKYLTLKSAENNSSKAEYVVNSKENKKEVKLDTYVSPEIPAVPASSPNDDFYTYYNNINGEVKLNISGTFVNPKYYSINVGNTVTFSDSLMYPEKAYGKAFTDVIFMITSITRSVGSIKFTAREIGSL